MFVLGGKAATSNSHVVIDVDKSHGRRSESTCAPVHRRNFWKFGTKKVLLRSKTSSYPKMADGRRLVSIIQEKGGTSKAEVARL